MTSAIINPEWRMANDQCKALKDMDAAHKLMYNAERQINL